MIKKMFAALILSAVVSSCTVLMLKPADFSWPVESVLTVDENGYVHEKRYSISINLNPLFFEETGDSSNTANKQVRIIRDSEGFYYITSQGFKNVYLFLPAESGMKLYKKINIYADKTLENPAMNQRPPYIELIDAQNKFLMNKAGVAR
ncbi:hypothetical protein ACSSWA_09725 [Melioribacter sp. Ez-97]|uniref:hypothetical protein n=1 Tax=Melioribacter sp. Ez-97 TaxID=3423434 RepID=UPI003ED856A1